MASANIIGLIFTLFLAICMGVIFSSAEDEVSKKVPDKISDILEKSNLENFSNWDIVIVRRSGYAHSSFEFSGSKIAAIEFANLKLRKARIEFVEIRRNESRKLEVSAFYDSSGGRRTGKYIGGYVIVPK